MPKLGHTFSGWKDETSTAFSGVKQGGGTFTMPGANVTLTAQWSVNSYTLTVNLDGGSGGSGGSTSGTYAFGATISLMTTSPSKSGYSFVGWKRLDTGGTVSAPFTMPATNVTLQAQWTALPTYQVQYYLNGGSGSVTDDNNYIAGDTVTIKSYN
jgi:uncharacterized repeat protein (TIGR02543 family)